MVEVSTSLLNVKKDKVKEVILNLESAGTNYFHIDVMDGKFVENSNYENMLYNAKEVEQTALTPMDVHLMVEDVEDAIYDFAKYSPNIITFHLEACKNDLDVKDKINLIKDLHCRVGIAIKPKTNIEQIFPYLPYIHQVLVMTVEPGKGGQTMLSNMEEKVAKLKKYIDDNNLDVEIAVDGGINLVTAPKLKKAGANVLVSGNAILLANDYKVIIDELKEE